MPLESWQPGFANFYARSLAKVWCWPTVAGCGPRSFGPKAGLNLAQLASPEADIGCRSMEGLYARHASTELLGKRDNDALRPADLG